MLKTHVDSKAVVIDSAMHLQCSQPLADIALQVSTPPYTEANQLEYRRLADQVVFTRDAPDTGRHVPLK